MGLLDAAESVLALFGATSPKARPAALLLAAVLLDHRPKLPEIVLDLDEGV
jgi:hypothetical protein